MPFKSEKQRAFMWSQHPEIARRWQDEGKGYVAGNKDTGGTVADNRPVGSAGQPNPMSNARNMKKHEKNDDKRFGAIERRMNQLNGKGGK